MPWNDHSPEEIKKGAAKSWNQFTPDEIKSQFQTPTKTNKVGGFAVGLAESYNPLSLVRPAETFGREVLNTKTEMVPDPHGGITFKPVNAEEARAKAEADTVTPEMSVKQGIGLFGQPGKNFVQNLDPTSEAAGMLTGVGLSLGTAGVKALGKTEAVGNMFGKIFGTKTGKALNKAEQAAKAEGQFMELAADQLGETDKRYLTNLRENIDNVEDIAKKGRDSDVGLDVTQKIRDELKTAEKTLGSKVSEFRDKVQKSDLKIQTPEAIKIMDKLNPQVSIGTPSELEYVLDPLYNPTSRPPSVDYFKFQEPNYNPTSQPPRVVYNRTKLSSADKYMQSTPDDPVYSSVQPGKSNPVYQNYDDKIYSKVEGQQSKPTYAPEDYDKILKETKPGTSTQVGKDKFLNGLRVKLQKEKSPGAILDLVDEIDSEAKRFYTIMSGGGKSSLSKLDADYYGQLVDMRNSLKKSLYKEFPGYSDVDAPYSEFKDTVFNIERKINGINGESYVKNIFNAGKTEARQDLEKALSFAGNKAPEFLQEIKNTNNANAILGIKDPRLDQANRTFVKYRNEKLNQAEKVGNVVGAVIGGVSGGGLLGPFGGVGGALPGAAFGGKISKNIMLPSATKYGQMMASPEKIFELAKNANNLSAEAKVLAKDLETVYRVDPSKAKEMMQYMAYIPAFKEFLNFAQSQQEKKP